MDKERIPLGDELDKINKSLEEGNYEELQGKSLEIKHPKEVVERISVTKEKSIERVAQAIAIIMESRDGISAVDAFNEFRNSGDNEKFIKENLSDRDSIKNVLDLANKIYIEQTGKNPPASNAEELVNEFSIPNIPDDAIVVNTPEGDKKIREIYQRTIETGANVEGKNIFEKISNSGGKIKFEDFSKEEQDEMMADMFEMALNGVIQKEYSIMFYDVIMETPTFETKLKVLQEMEEYAALNKNLSNERYTNMEVIKHVKYSIRKITTNEKVFNILKSKKKLEKINSKAIINLEVKSNDDRDALEKFLMSLDTTIVDLFRQKLLELGWWVGVLSIYRDDILKNLSSGQSG